MYDIKTKTETTHREFKEITISDKIFNLFVEWVKSTKLSKQKLKILKQLEREDYLFLEIISSNLNMSLPLLSYHLHGNLKSEGLKDAELIESKVIHKGKVGIRLTEFGEKIIKLLEV